jgi:3-deoxy-manno-octulosonate cytidylyltransferase (CMP-KDO synthetase)
MEISIVIPARFNSSRLLGKVLLDLAGKPIIQRVYEQCISAQGIKSVFIATDSIEVYEECKKFTDNVLITSSEHESGTDRIVEALSYVDGDYIINVQGDEPFISPQLIEDVMLELNGGYDIVSAMHIIENSSELINPNVVKVTVNKKDEALYFSRSCIPYCRENMDEILSLDKINSDNYLFYRHLGLYAYSRVFLENFKNMKPTFLEKTEKLEQLRALENGCELPQLNRRL